MKKGLRVLLITQGVTRLVQPLLNSRHIVVGVLESAPRHVIEKSFFSSLLRIPRFFYSKIVKTELTLEQKAKAEGLSYRLMTSSDDQGLIEWVNEIKPDVIVVFSMSQLLKESIFSIPKMGTINLHPSFLPEYRGPNPCFWQYHNMEMNPGVTVHYIDEGEDTGDIIFQERVYIPLGTKSTARLNILIGKIGIPLVLRALDEIEAGVNPRIKQPLESPTARAKHLKLSNHKTIIDWHLWPIERIWNVLRGT